jgi:hypothetical protein
MIVPDHTACLEEVASLHHEAGNDSVKVAPLVAHWQALLPARVVHLSSNETPRTAAGKCQIAGPWHPSTPVLAGAQLTEVFTCLRANVGKQLELDAASQCASNGHVWLGNVY